MTLNIPQHVVGSFKLETQLAVAVETALQISNRRFLVGLHQLGEFLGFRGTLTLMNEFETQVYDKNGQE